MKTHELLPCPFCGCLPELRDKSDKLMAIVCPASSSCADSGLAMAFAPANRDKAVAQWNHRADPATVKESLTTEQPEDGPVATLLAPDPEDERAGFWLSCEDNRRLASLPAGTTLYTGEALESVKAERDALRWESQKWADECRRVFSENADLRERVEELEERLDLENTRNERLREEIHGLEKDAARYRGLRERAIPSWDGRRGPVLVYEEPRPRTGVDVAVDAAMQEGKS